MRTSSPFRPFLVHAGTLLAAALLLTVLACGPAAAEAAYSVQLDTANHGNKFSELRQQVYDSGLPEYVIAAYEDEVKFYVHVGPYATVAEAKRAQRTVQDELGLAGTIVLDHSTEPVDPTRLAALETPAPKPAPAPAAKATPQPPTAPKAETAIVPLTDSDRTVYSVQVCSFQTVEKARRVLEAFQAKGFTPIIIMLYDEAHKPWHVVETGRFDTFDAAKAQKEQLDAQGAQAIIHKLALSLIRERVVVQ